MASRAFGIRRRSVSAAALAGAFAAFALAAALPAGASADVPAGFDLFETSPQQTFTQIEVPPDFFNPGSDALATGIHWAGEPLNLSGGRDLGDADTVVRRSQPAELMSPFPDTSDPIPIEIVQLNLVSVEPIVVTSNGGQDPRLWSVEVDLHPDQIQGQMQIVQQSRLGGTFQSQLPVNATLTFTRLSDGRTQSFTEGINFQAEDVPWRRGCRPPALRLRGINDEFCPGLTPEGDKHLTVEQAAFAAHGIFPVQPRLEHFECYTTRGPRFRPRRVALRDQFGGRRAGVPVRAELCNPVRKNRERFDNPRAHLQCYGTRGQAANRLVAVRNQLGSQRLVVKRPRRLCLPSLKRKPGERFRRIRPRQRIDHVQCYGVRPRTGLLRLGRVGPVVLRDQFGARRVRLGRPFQLCAPVSKNGSGVQHRVRHLVCYRFKHRRIRQRYAIANQFERRGLLAVRPHSLCVPSSKLVAR